MNQSEQNWDQPVTSSNPLIQAGGFEMDKVVDSNQIQAVIMVTKGSDSAIVARLDGSSLLVGRELPADLVIDNQFVSRRHFWKIG